MTAILHSSGKLNMKTILRVLACVAACTTLASAFGYGEVDPTYRSVPIVGWSCEQALTSLADDSVLIAVVKNPGQSPSHAVAKVRADGTLDPTWQGGVAPIGTDLNPALAILAAADGGAIVVSPTSLTRLRSDGGIDTAYGTNGRYGGGPSDAILNFISSAALEPDGSVVALVQQNIGLGAYQSFFVHVLASGTLDIAFGTSGRLGIADPHFGGGEIYAWSVKGDGSVEVGYGNGLPPSHPLLRRFPVDFTDADRPKGRVMPRAGIASWVADNVLVDGAGGAVFAVMTQLDGQPGVRLVRFLPDGSTDPGFGLVTLVPPTIATTQGNSVKLSRSAEGKWTAFLDVSVSSSGFVPVVVARTRYALRFGADGRPDASFPSDVEMPATPMERLNTGKLLTTAVPDTPCQTQRRLTDGEPRVDGILVEYYHPLLRHYFLTLDTFEAAILDSNPTGWTRTGRTFAAWQPVPAPATTAVCRFYGDPVIGPNSHFYTPEGPECDGLIALQQATPAGQPAWHLEGKPFRVSLPSADGTCPGNLDPVFRVFNGPADNAHGPTHRYTTDPALYAQMQSLGWLPEGAHFCVPPLGPR